MRVRAEGTWRETDALDLREGDRGREAVCEAVAGDAGWLECPAPGPLWDHVAPVAPGEPVPTRTALAAAARSRGLTAPQDDERRAVLTRRDGIEVESVETAPLRRRLAAASADTDRLRETVARLQGRVQATREADRATDDEDELAGAVRRLSERETERAAARQALDRARTRRRAARDAREERRRLADRAANLARAARRHLVERVDDEFRAAVDAVPGGEADPADPFESDPVTRALAIARVGEPRAPVVLDCDRFPSARAAATWLSAPVVRL
ncbi:DUF7856 family protein [Halomarina litorea]|uniref:DUF7856 family protein n=1 Tax=Halomarina litorea TaxID=2961595 RepID=UPI0020C4B3FD|nr:hypothetical protein [Halomarina sp. BCD28]